jgi:hypothetical protein
MQLVRIVELSSGSGREQTCFRNTRMGVDIGTYRARIGTYVRIVGR